MYSPDKSSYPRIFEVISEGYRIEEDLDGYRVIVSKNGATLDGVFTSPLFARRALQSYMIEQELATAERKEKGIGQGRTKKEQ